MFFLFDGVRIVSGKLRCLDSSELHVFSFLFFGISFSDLFEFPELFLFPCVCVFLFSLICSESPKGVDSTLPKTLTAKKT